MCSRSSMQKKLRRSLPSKSPRPRCPVDQVTVSAGMKVGRLGLKILATSKILVKYIDYDYSLQISTIYLKIVSMRRYIPFNTYWNWDESWQVSWRVTFQFLWFPFMFFLWDGQGRSKNMQKTDRQISTSFLVTLPLLHHTTQYIHDTRAILR